MTAGAFDCLVEDLNARSAELDVGGPPKIQVRPGATCLLDDCIFADARGDSLSNVVADLVTADADGRPDGSGQWWTSDSVGRQLSQRAADDPSPQASPAGMDGETQRPLRRHDGHAVGRLDDQGEVVAVSVERVRGAAAADCRLDETVGMDLPQPGELDRR